MFIQDPVIVCLQKMDMFIVLTCLILSHGITRTRCDSDLDKMLDEESNIEDIEKRDQGGNAKPDKKEPSKVENESSKKKGAEKEGGGTSKPDKDAENKDKKEKSDSKNEKSPGKEAQGKEANEKAGKGHEAGDKTKEQKPNEKKAKETESHSKEKNTKEKPETHPLEGRRKSSEDEKEKAAAEAMKKLAEQAEGEKHAGNAPTKATKKSVEKKEEAEPAIPDKSQMAHNIIHPVEDATQKAPNPNPDNADIESMIHGEQSRVRGEELEEAELAGDPEQARREKAQQQAEAERSAVAEETKKAAAAEAEKAAEGHAKKTNEEKSPPGDETPEDGKNPVLDKNSEKSKQKSGTDKNTEQNDADVEKMVKEQGARERAKELEEGEKAQVESPGKETDFSAMEKKVANEREKGNQKTKPGENEHGKAEEEGKKEKDKDKEKDEGNENSKKSESEKDDKKSKPGQSEHGKAEEESKKEKLSPVDKEKETSGKSEPGKDDKNSKHDRKGQIKQNRARFDSEWDKTLWDAGERSKRDKVELEGAAPATKPDENKQETPKENLATKTTFSENTKAAAPKEVGTAEAGAADNVTTSAVDDLTLLKESKSVSRCIMNELPDELREKIQETDDAEERVLTSCVISENVPFNIIHGYTVAKDAERTFLKELLPELGSEAETVLAAYRALRKGDAWTYIKLDGRFKAFFKQPSNALALYLALKADEKKTLDSFLNSQSPEQTDNVTLTITINVTRRSFAEEASVKLEGGPDNTLQRKVPSDGVGGLENNNTTDRGNDTAQNEFETLEDDFEDTSPSEEVTITSSDKQINKEQHNSVLKLVIICSLIGELIVAFVIVMACRRQVAKLRMKNKETDLETETQPLRRYNRIEDHETDDTEHSEHFAISVTSADVTGHP